MYSPETWNALTNPDSSYYHSMWKPFIVFETVANIIIAGVIVGLLVMLYSKKKQFPKWMIVFLVGNLLLMMVDYGMALQLPVFQQVDDGSAAADIVRSMIYSCIWIPYFLRSKRVRNTFVK